MEKDCPADLVRRIRRLEDIEEIRSLRMRYHVCVNEGDFGGVHTLFLPDATVDMGSVGQARGSAEIDALFRRIPENLQLVKQFIHNHLIEIDGDKANGISYIDARYAKDGESVIVAGSFRERYQRTAEGWRIEYMLLTLFFAVPIQKGWAGTEINVVEPLR